MQSCVCAISSKILIDFFLYLICDVRVIKVVGISSNSVLLFWNLGRGFADLPTAGIRLEPASCSFMPSRVNQQVGKKGSRNESQQDDEE